MDPDRDPRPSTAPAPSRDTPPDHDAVVALLRSRAPGLPTPRSDPRTVTARARRALRRRRFRASASTVTAAAAAYLALAFAGPLPVPGTGTVTVPGSRSLRALAGNSFPFGPPGSDQRQADVNRLESEVLPVVEALEVSLYLLSSGPCRSLEYPRGNYRDGDPECSDLVPFDARARADFDAVTDAVGRSGVAVERITRDGAGTYVHLNDRSWRYNWEYAYLPGVGSPPTAGHPAERWTHIRGNWWLHRTHDD